MMIEVSLHIQVVLAGACIITSSVTAGNNSVPGGRIKIKLCLGYNQGRNLQSGQSGFGRTNISLERRPS